MKRKFIITEVANYEVEVDGGPDAALEKFLDGNVNDFPCNIGEREIVESGKPLEVGDNVNVDAHGAHEEDFSGVIVSLDPLQVKAPDGETYDCDPDYVYAPSTDFGVPAKAGTTVVGTTQPPVKL